MDIRWRKYSHSLLTKIIVFIIAAVSFAAGISIFFNTAVSHEGNFEAAFEKSYYLGSEFIMEGSDIVESLTQIAGKYQSEEHILSGGALAEEDIRRAEENLFFEFQNNSRSYNPNLTEQENYQIFKEVYADKISEEKDRLIKEQLRAYRETLRRLEKYQGIIYYAKIGENELTNSSNKAKGYFQSFPAYIVFDGSEEKAFPAQVMENTRYHWLIPNSDQLGTKDTIYVAFSKEYLDPRIEKWEENKIIITNSLKQIGGLLLAFLAAFIYLAAVIGRGQEKDQDQDKEVQLNFVDRIYNDLKLIMCLLLIGSWFGAMAALYHLKIYQLVFPVTLLISSLGLVLVLSLVKNIKNRNLFKHSLIYIIFYKLFRFIKDVYDSGSVAVKVLLVVIVYPIIAAVTFFMFPITIGAAVWFAHKKVKEFNAIKEGVMKAKEGDIHYRIDVPGNGEFAMLASDINSITDGLNKAVANEIKSERLKTELITNVSHDIRTPLTAIITYVDLLKNEKDQAKMAEYIEVIDQKSQRLKILTEDLFEAAKASSGNIPVNFEEIELVSLITQGLGELDDKIQDRNLEFKLNHPKEKVFIKADGKLLWRAIENLFSNIFKYALTGSRVYIDIIDQGHEVMLIIKNISAFELNISADELMERFKRGDESRSSQGSGLGLSIAKSLIEMQKGSFKIEIDGDLFKAMVQIPK
ncbi:MAG: HAMP domain-containing sensor histidine kinase [Dehalobacterium sp.]